MRYALLLCSILFAWWLTSSNAEVDGEQLSSDPAPRAQRVRVPEDVVGVRKVSDVVAPTVQPLVAEAPSLVGDVHPLVLPYDQDLGVPTGANRDLDIALEQEQVDEDWLLEVGAAVEERLQRFEVVTVDDVKCVQTFCRVVLRRPLEAEDAPWDQIDRSLADVARGEAIFRAEPEGNDSVGYLYFSSDDAHLPMGDVVDEPEGV